VRPIVNLFPLLVDLTPEGVAEVPLPCEHEIKLAPAEVRKGYEIIRACGGCGLVYNLIPVTDELLKTAGRTNPPGKILVVMVV
jgi:hypothetical protein